MPKKSRDKKSLRRKRVAGNNLGRQSKDFADEVGRLGENFGNRMEHFGQVFGSRSDRWEQEREMKWRNRRFSPFGFIGPFIGSVMSVVCLALGAWLAKIVGILLASEFILSLSNFIFANIHWFFLASLFFGYSGYFSRRHGLMQWILSPIIAGIGTTIVVWIGILMLNMANVFAKSSIIAAAASFLYANLAGIFVLVLVLGYILKIIRELRGYSEAY